MRQCMSGICKLKFSVDAKHISTGTMSLRMGIVVHVVSAESLSVKSGIPS